MKGVVLAATAAVLLFTVSGAAGQIHTEVSAGPGSASFGQLNHQIGAINTIISDVNESVTTMPNLSGQVPALDDLGSGFGFRASERYSPADWIALGATFSYFQTSTSTAGTYTSDVEASEITLAFDSFDIGLLISGRVTFLDVGILVMSGQAAAGYYACGITRAVTFEIPAEILAQGTYGGLPPEGEARYHGGTFGYEAGLRLGFPLSDWFQLTSSITYRSPVVRTLTDAEGNGLDIDGNGNTEMAELDGIVVQFGASIDLDLSL